MSYTDSSPTTPEPVAASATPHPDAAAKPGYDPEAAARVRAERQAKRDSKRRSLMEFVPRESVAVIDAPIVLHSEITQKNFSLWYSYAQSASFMLREALSRMTSVENQEQTAVLVNNLIANTRKEMEDELARLKAVADDVGLRQERKFTAPKEMIVPCYTSEALDFLHLIRVYDEILWFAEAVQILRGITNSKKIALRSRYKSRLTELVRSIAHIWVRAKASARREHEARAAADEARFLARHASIEQSPVSAVEHVDSDVNAPEPA